MKFLLVSLLVLLAILHQDFWWWDDPTPVFGFLPVGLAWHILISIASGLVWWLITKYGWPDQFEELDEIDGRTGGE